MYNKLFKLDITVLFVLNVFSPNYILSLKKLYCCMYENKTSFCGSNNEFCFFIIQCLSYHYHYVYLYASPKKRGLFLLFLNFLKTIQSIVVENMNHSLQCLGTRSEHNKFSICIMNKIKV